MDKIYKRKKQQEIEEDEDDEDSDESDEDPNYRDCPICGRKKDYIEEKYITEKRLIKSLTVIFKENTFWDLAFLATTWLTQDFDEFIPSLCTCGKINKQWLTDNNIFYDVEFDGQPSLCKKYQFSDKVSYFNHLCQQAQQKSLIHYGLWQFLNILYPNLVKHPKTKKNVSEKGKQFMNDSICGITVIKR